MVCPRCGLENPETNKICPGCGVALEGDQQKAASQPPPVGVYQQPAGFYQPQGQVPPYPYGGYPVSPEEQAGRSAAIASLVCGIIGFSCVGCGIVGLVLGIIALIQAKKVTVLGQTNGMATAGRILGIISIIFSILVILFYIAYFAMMVGLLAYYDWSYFY